MQQLALILLGSFICIRCYAGSTLYDCRFATLIENQRYIPLLQAKVVLYVDTSNGAFIVDEEGEAVVEKVTANQQHTFILSDKITQLSHVTTIKKSGLSYHVKNLTLLGEDHSTILQGHCSSNKTFL